MSNIDITRLDNLMWRVAHMETGIYLDFKEGCFNDRQEAHCPADLTDATTICDIENGKRNPSLTTLLKITDALGMKIEILAFS